MVLHPSKGGCTSVPMDRQAEHALCHVQINPVAQKLCCGWTSRAALSPGQQFSHLSPSFLALLQLKGALPLTRTYSWMVTQPAPVHCLPTLGELLAHTSMCAEWLGKRNVHLLLKKENVRDAHQTPQCIFSAYLCSGTDCPEKLYLSHPWKCPHWIAGIKLEAHMENKIKKR